jgi:hypothetical protein
MEEGLIRRVMASMKCGVCGQCYEPDNISVLGHQEDLWFLRVFCSACHTQYLVAAVIREGKMPEVITDLTKAESGKFRNAARLTADEMLDMHNFLKDFDGDISRLFSRK